MAATALDAATAALVDQAWQRMLKQIGGLPNGIPEQLSDYMAVVAGASLGNIDASDGLISLLDPVEFAPSPVLAGSATLVSFKGTGSETAKITADGSFVPSSLVTGNRLGVATPDGVAYTSLISILDQTSDVAASHAAIDSVVEVNPSGPSTRTYRSGNFDVSTPAANAQNITALVASQGSVYHNGTGTVSSLWASAGVAKVVGNAAVTSGRGVYADYWNSAGGVTATGVGLYADVFNTGAGSITLACGVQAKVRKTGAGNIGAAHTFYALNSIDTGGAITAKSGLTIEEMTSALANTDLLIGTGTIPAGDWAIYSASARASSLAGSLAVTGPVTASYFGIPSLWQMSVGANRGQAITYNLTDAADACALSIESSTVLTTAGAQLLRLKNGPREKLYVDHYGILYAGLDAVGGLQTDRLTKPAIASVTDIPSAGGSLLASTTYTYRVAAIGRSGSLTDMSVVSSVTTSADGLNTHAANVVWGHVMGARTYRVYGRTNGVGDKFLASVDASVLNWVDDGNIVEGAVGPATNDSGGAVINGSLVADDAVLTAGSYGLAQDGASLYWYGANARGVISANVDDSGGARTALTLKNATTLVDAASKIVSFAHAAAEAASITKGGILTLAGALSVPGGGVNQMDTILTANATTLALKGQPATSGTAVGATIGAYTNLTTTGDKVVSFVNNSATEVAAVTKDGVLQFPAGDSVLTPGGATINKVTGRSALASGAAAVTITNSYVTGDSNVFIQRGLDDATAVQLSVQMAQALVNGATRVCKSLTFTGATGAYIVGETITETGSGATGVVEAVEQGAGAGTLVLSTAGAFTGSAVLTGSAAAVTSNGGATVAAALAVDWDNQDTNFTVGRQVVGRSSGAKGTIVAQNDAGATGTLGLTAVTGAFSDNEQLNDGGKFKVTANAVATNHVPFMWWVVNQ